MSELSGVNSGVNSNNISFQADKNKKDVKDNKPSKDEGMRKSTKLMIGASALALAVIGGVILHKGNAAKKTAKEAEKLANHLKQERERMPMLFANTVKEAELTAKLEEIDKLSPAEQNVAYQQLRKMNVNILELNYASASKKVGDEIVLRRGMRGIPKDVQEEMTAGNMLKAAELYEAHVQALPVTFRPKNVGANIEETISKVFGAESKVKPHTYDLAKEGEEIISLRDCGGFYDVVATKEGVLYEGGGKTTLSRAISNSDNFWKKATKTPIKDGASITHGVDKDGKYVTILNMPDNSVAGRPTTITLGLISRNSKMSPAQKDLLSLAEHPEKFDASLIDTVTLKNSPEVTGAENMDYDLVLSAIQSMVK